MGEKAAHVALDLKPPRPGLVYCCPSMGWVTPHERGAHVMDDDYGDPDDYGAPTAREVRYTVPMDVVEDGHDTKPLIATAHGPCSRSSPVRIARLLSGPGSRT